MDDKYFFGAFIYLFIIFTAAGALPSSLWTGSYTSLQTGSNYSDTIQADLNETATPTNALEGSSFVLRLGTLLFVPFIIPGIPALLGTFLAVLNYLCVFVGAIFIYDKIRGIGG